MFETDETVVSQEQPENSDDQAVPVDVTDEADAELETQANEGSKIISVTFSGVDSRVRGNETTHNQERQYT